MSLVRQGLLSRTGLLAPVSRLGLAAQRGGGGFMPQVIYDPDNGDWSTAYPNASVVTTAANVVASVVAGSQRIGIAAGNEIDPLLLGSYDGLNIQGIGDIEGMGLPIIDGAVEITGPWTLAAGTTNVYSKTITPTGFDAAGVTYPLVWENGRRLRAIAEDTDLATTLANLDALDTTNESYIFYEITTVQNGAGVVGDESFTIYVHLQGSSNPNTNNNLYEVVNETYCLRVNDNCTLKNLYLRRGGSNSGPLDFGLNMNAENLFLEEGLRHVAVGESGTLRNCVGWVQQDDPRTGMHLFTFYVGDAQPGDAPASLVAHYDRCLAVVEDISLPITGGYYNHTGGGAEDASKYLNVRITDSAAYNCGFLADDTEGTEMARVNGVNSYLAVAGADPVVTDANLVYSAENLAGNSIIQPDPDKITGSLTFDGLRVAALAVNSLPGVVNGGIRALSDTTAFPININRSVFFLSAAFGNVAGNQGSPILISAPSEWNITGSVFDCGDDATRSRIMIESADHNPSITGENNIYAYPESSENAFRFVAGNPIAEAIPDANGRLTTAQYLSTQQGTFNTETGSISVNTTDPIFVDPANGDWTLIGSVTPPANCGLERPDITYTPAFTDFGDAMNYAIHGNGLGLELHTDPDFDDAAGWTAPGEWSVSGGVATITDPTGGFGLRSRNFDAGLYYYEVEVTEHSLDRDLNLMVVADGTIISLGQSAGVKRGFVRVQTGGNNVQLRPASAGTGTMTVTRFSMRPAGAGVAPSSPF